MTGQDRNLGTRWFDEVWNKGRREAIAEMLAPDAVLHEGGLDSVGPEGFYPLFDRIRNAFSQIQTTVHDTFAEGDRICIRWSFQAKHSGPGLGIPPSGKNVDATGITIMRIDSGKAVEGWQNWDMLGMLDQIRGGAKAPTYVGVPSPASMIG
jgi:steroid delta-isomerase-like uncharacterized protein